MHISALSSVLTVLVLCLARARYIHAAPKTFLWVTDVHLDLHYGTPAAYAHHPTIGCSTPDVPPLGRAGCDAPEALLNVTLQAMVTALPDPPAFVLMTGDAARHDVGSVAELERALTRVSDLLEDAFPTAAHLHAPSLEMHHALLMPTLGNNDVTPDYHLNLTANNTLLRAAAAAWADQLTAEETASVLEGGYLAREMAPGVLVVSLNTVIYSVKHIPKDAPLEADPLGQFAWLNTTLQQASAAKQHVFLVGHIPPGIDSYGFSPFWHDEYSSTLYQLIAAYNHVIPALLFGHLHSDEFRVDTALGLRAPPLLIAASVTPVFGNNPSFRTVTYDNTTGDLIDYQVWTMDLSKKATTFTLYYSFLDEYPAVERLDSDGLLELACALTQDEAFLKLYAVRSEGGAAASASSNTGLEWGCLISKVTQTGFEACNSSGKAHVCPSSGNGTTTTSSSSTKTTTTTPVVTTTASTAKTTTSAAGKTTTTAAANTTTTVAPETTTTAAAKTTTTAAANTTTTAAATTAAANTTTTLKTTTTHATTTKSSKAGGSGGDKPHVSALGAGMAILVALTVIGVFFLAQYVARRRRNVAAYNLLSVNEEPGVV